MLQSTVWAAVKLSTKLCHIQWLSSEFKPPSPPTIKTAVQLRNPGLIVQSAKSEHLNLRLNASAWRNSQTQCASAAVTEQLWCFFPGRGKAHSQQHCPISPARSCHWLGANSLNRQKTKTCTRKQFGFLAPRGLVSTTASRSEGAEWHRRERTACSYSFEQWRAPQHGIWLWLKDSSKTKSLKSVVKLCIFCHCLSFESLTLLWVSRSDKCFPLAKSWFLSPF